MRKRAKALLKAIATTFLGMIAAYAVASAAGNYVANIARTFKPATSAPQPKARPQPVPIQRPVKP